MHLSFVVVITSALAACMTVTAKCSPQFGTCARDSDCCKGFKCDSSPPQGRSKFCDY
ncbi:hypothetical protein BDR06DRAFT_953606 [Suillus hirtellus]|nr:hypothetical protein BDR06DRAFT_953606 [Suillus hirtellus]